VRPIDPELLGEAKRALDLSVTDIERATHRAKLKVRPKAAPPEKRS
jgi:hypothetical protein